MDDLTRKLVALSAAVAAGDPPVVARAMDAVLDAPPTAVEEALLQTYLFVGYPAALRALTEWRERTGQRASGSDDLGWEDWTTRGVDVFSKVYGGQHDRLRANVAALHPDLERWMITEGYGKVLGRPGLDLRTRELCIIGLLCAQRSPRQLYSHLRGALNVGASPDDVEEALEIAGRFISPGLRQSADSVWREVQDRTSGKEW